MPIKISQFHPEREQRACLSRIRSGTRVYLDAEGDSGDPQPAHWCRYELQNSNKDPIYRPFKEGGVKLKIINKAATQFVKIPEVVAVIDKGNNSTSHSYEVATKFCFDRAPDLDRFINANPDTPIPIFFPSGTEIETVESYEVILRDSRSTTTSIGVDLKGLSNLLGLDFGLNLRAESKHQKEIQDKRTNLNSTKIIVPPGIQIAQARTSFMFEIAFRRCVTEDGVTWVPIGEYRLPIEVWCWHLLRCSDNVDNGYRDQLLATEINKYKPEVTKWLSEQQARAEFSFPNR